MDNEPRDVEGELAIIEEVDGQLSRSDIKLVSTAVRARWPIPDELRPMLIKSLAATALAGSSDRDRNGAAKTLVTMDAQNLEQEKRDQGIADQVVVTHTGSIDLASLTDEQLERLARGR